MTESLAERVPELKDLTGIEGLDLRPEEAFVLSRVDGRTSLGQIAAIVGFDVEKVWGLLSRIAEAGYLRFCKVEAPKGTRARRKPALLDVLDAEDRDAKLSRIPRDTRRILRMAHVGISAMNHYEFLGVAASARDDEIRRKYFEVSKLYHPDRYFGVDLGPYEAVLSELFARATAAFDELSDRAKRREYDEKLLSERAGATDYGSAHRKPSKKSPTLIERLAQGRKYAMMARKEEALGNMIAAANMYRMAKHFDAENSEFKAGCARTEPFLLRKRADDIYQQARGAIEANDATLALSLLEECHRLNPRKKECSRDLAIIYLRKKKQLGRARELAEQAVGFFPEDATAHGTLGLICLELDLVDEARKSLRRALRLDGQNAEAKEGLARLEGKGD